MGGPIFWPFVSFCMLPSINLDPYTMGVITDLVGKNRQKIENLLIYVFLFKDNFLLKI